MTPAILLALLAVAYLAAQTDPATLALCVVIAAVVAVGYGARKGRG